MQRMVMISLATLVLSMTACSPSTPSDDALADFVPPTLVKREEVRAWLEKRFADRDVDGDRRLTRVELGSTRADRIAGADVDQDGAISHDEFIAHGLARFDKTDANKDKMVTNKEQAAARAAAAATPTPEKIPPATSVQ